MFNVVATENPEDSENLINPFYVIEENPKPEED